MPSWPGAGWLITLALTSQVLGWLLITISLPRLPAALTSLLLTVQPVGSVALAALIFSESPSSSSCRRRDRARGAVLEPGAAPPGARSLACVATPSHLNRSSRLRAEQRAAPGPVVGGDVAPGAADEHHRLLMPSLVRARSAAAASSSATAIHVALQLAAGRVRAPAPVLERREAGAADRDVALAVAPGAAERVGDHDRRGDAGQLAERARMPAPSRRDRRGSSTTVSSPGTFEASTPAFAQTKP